jgi:hypothetical protein
MVSLHLLNCYHQIMRISLNCHADVPLMEWLRKYTFPTEESYKDREAAEVNLRHKLCIPRIPSSYSLPLPLSTATTSW